ncbi:MAG: hypothetical protein B7Y45_11525 [Sphingomonas sp. 28-66-16]|nr:MAG: hypothetical protein B7Y45_11525 [Sphingomonas sp. 28-66-16]
MKRTTIAAALLIAAFGAPAASAKDGALTVSLLLRTRGEAIDGQFRPAPAADDAALLFRSELRAEYDAGPIRFGGELIDARAYFQRRNSSIATTEVNAIEPVQAYLQSDVSDRARLTLGRFTMNIGSRRLVSRQVFRNSTNAFTGARLELKSRAGDSATLFWTLPQTRLPDDRDAIQRARVELDRERLGLQFFGASVVSRPLAGTTIEAYLYRLAEHDAPTIQTRDRRLWTPGVRLYRAPARGKTDFEIEAAWQTGTIRRSTRPDDTIDLPVSAWFAHADIGHSFAGRWAPRLALQADVASGDGPGGDYRRFDPLFGARAFEFGPTSLYGAVSRANLISVEARAEVTPSPRWDGYVAVRPLWLAAAGDSFSGTGVRDPGGTAGRYAGTQIDGRVRYWLVPKHARVAAGYADLFKGRFLTVAANAPATGDTHYGYLELTLTL